jgi:rhodanese-related sulfurtransferase
MTREEEMRLQKLWFEAKLAAEKGKNEVARQAKTGQGDLVIVDTRGHDAYARGHVPGAISLPLDEIDARADELDRAREHVTYCWNAT